jgi:uncharacterized membrane protein YphA (DoxX/SURF4 family)
MMQDHRTEQAYWALRLTFGVVPIVAGLDKFTNLLADWQAQVHEPAVMRHGRETRSAEAHA